MNSDKASVHPSTISRNICVICEGGNREQLFVFNHFPMLMYSTEAPKETDCFVDMNWYVCSDCGCIQLDPVIPKEVLYQRSHSDMVGELWKKFYIEFSEFMFQYAPQRIFEIGGAHGKLSRAYKKIAPDSQWTILEPDPLLSNEELDVRIIKGYFDERFDHEWSYDACVHTNVMEHIHYPLAFMSKLRNFVPVGGMMIFAVPDMHPLLDNYYLSCLDPEHTYFLSENYIAFLMRRYGFKILGKKYFPDAHSIFYAAKRVDNIVDDACPRDVDKNKHLFNKYTSHYLGEIRRLNQAMAGSRDKIYLFGAHIFSQYLIAFGLETSRIECILDNSPLKQGKRLYGTNFMVRPPGILKGRGKVSVILKAGMYNREIMDDILGNINSKVDFWL